jgi:hypothetical protein
MVDVSVETRVSTRHALSADRATMPKKTPDWVDGANNWGLTALSTGEGVWRFAEAVAPWDRVVSPQFFAGFDVFEGASLQRGGKKLSGRRDFLRAGERIGFDVLNSIF